MVNALEGQLIGIPVYGKLKSADTAETLNREGHPDQSADGRVGCAGREGYCCGILGPDSARTQSGSGAGGAAGAREVRVPEFDGDKVLPGNVGGLVAAGNPPRRPVGPQRVEGEAGWHKAPQTRRHDVRQAKNEAADGQNIAGRDGAIAIHI